MTMLSSLSLTLYAKGSTSVHTANQCSRPRIPVSARWILMAFSFPYTTSLVSFFPPLLPLKTTQCVPVFIEGFIDTPVSCLSALATWA
ncbi:hypothetical protein BDN70DRAFT_422720 [Pholiota conissans]|uniref:Uncharacterized protein n=1 Tax=Pholiota conissans TaxID=109636 RepID=A0A9P5YND6_9AGAR|nr:hypothetical protein BDN70DRAFT_422720 [Pholiota conissans]